MEGTKALNKKIVGEKSFPQVALRSYLKLKEIPQFLRFTQAIITTLSRMIQSKERVRFVHEMIDHEMTELYKLESVQKYMACKKGCSGCCHTQVSVTSDEAELLASKVINGVEINWANLHKQKSASNNFKDFMAIAYEERRCVFLKDDQTCSVYEDRPSVCRTNAVVGSSEQCDTRDGNIQTQQILNTYNADMIIMGAYMNSEENGVLPSMLWKKIHEQSNIDLSTYTKNNKSKKSKEVSNIKTLR